MYGSDKQAERRERGEAFQLEIKRSWKLLPNLWRLRLTDAVGRIGTRPADEVVLTDKVNYLVEEKRTNGNQFTLSMLRPDQLKGLLEFEQALERNRGYVFVSFLNETTDEAYAFRLVDALVFMKQKNRRYINLEELHSGAIEVIALPLIEIDGERGYDLKGVLDCK